MALPTPRRTSFIPPVPKNDPRSAGSSKATTAAKSRTPTMNSAAKTATIPVVNLESSQAATTLPVQATPTAQTDPSSKKKRRSRDGEKSSSKRSRWEGSDPRPLTGGLLDPTSQRAIVESLSEKELTEAALEFTSHDAMLTWYLHRFADRRGVEEVQHELASSKKETEDVRAQLATLDLEHSKCKEAQEALTKKHEGACIEVATLTKQLTTLRTKFSEMAEENEQLKLSLQEAEGTGKKQKDEIARLTAEVATSHGTIRVLSEDVQIEHEEGFNKALR